MQETLPDRILAKHIKNIKNRFANPKDLTNKEFFTENTKDLKKVNDTLSKTFSLNNGNLDSVQMLVCRNTGGEDNLSFVFDPKESKKSKVTFGAMIIFTRSDNSFQNGWIIYI